MVDNEKNAEESDLGFAIFCTIIFAVFVLMSTLGSRIFWPWLFSKPSAYKVWKVVANIHKVLSKAASRKS
jgi:hypothetical protein